MCFSAEASFVASAGLAVVGVATLRQAEEPSDRMVAAIPIAFGAGLLVAYLIAYYAWFKTHPSVWCYFAALLSALIYLHFRFRGRPSRSESAGAG